MVNDLVTVRTYSLGHEAEIARGRLESEGIVSFVADQVMATTLPGSTGGFRLQVRNADLQRAQQLLVTIEQSNPGIARDLRNAPQKIMRVVGFIVLICLVYAVVNGIISLFE